MELAKGTVKLTGQAPRAQRSSLAKLSVGSGGEEVGRRRLAAVAMELC